MRNWGQQCEQFSCMHACQYCCLFQSVFFPPVNIFTTAPNESSSVHMKNLRNLFFFFLFQVSLEDNNQPRTVYKRDGNKYASQYCCLFQSVFCFCEYFYFILFYSINIITIFWVSLEDNRTMYKRDISLDFAIFLVIYSLFFWISVAKYFIMGLSYIH